VSYRIVKDRLVLNMVDQSIIYSAGFAVRCYTDCDISLPVKLACRNTRDNNLKHVAK